MFSIYWINAKEYDADPEHECIIILEYVAKLPSNVVVLSFIPTDKKC